MAAINTYVKAFPGQLAENQSASLFEARDGLLARGPSIQHVACVESGTTGAVPTIGTTSVGNITGTVTDTDDNAKTLINLGLAVCTATPGTVTISVTAKTFVRNLPNAKVGDMFSIVIVNNNASNALTIAAGGTGITLSLQNSNVIAGATVRTMRFVVTNVIPGSEAITIYG
jgi:hypothetical protein